MSLLHYVVGSFLNRVKDELRHGQDSGSRASATLGGIVHLEVDAVGEAGNDWTVEVTEPGGTSALTVTPTGTAVVVALSVSSGVGVDAENTSALIAAAWNAAVTGATARVMDDGTGFLDAAIAETPFTGGTAAGTGAGAPVGGGYLRAQDMSSVLDLLQDGLDTPVSLTATGGSATTVADGAGTFVPGQQVGNVVTFAGNVTAALTDVSATVLSNTDRLLTFTSSLPGSPASGDTYVIAGGMASGAISDLREGQGLADSPRGSVYGEFRQVLAGLTNLLERVGITQASGTLTLTGNAANTQTVTIGGKVYTFQDTLTNVDGNVDVGATASDSLDNLIAAINLGAGAGTAYAAATTLHPSVRAAAGAGDTMVVTAKVAVGAAGNSIATTETVTGTWAAATLTGGAIAATPAHTASRPGLAAGSGSTTTSVVSADTMRIDQFKGYVLTVAGEARKVVSNTETTLVLSKALTGAPALDTAFTLTLPYDAAQRFPGRFNLEHPAGHPDCAQLANLIDTVQVAVEAYTPPT